LGWNCLGKYILSSPVLLLRVSIRVIIVKLIAHTYQLDLRRDHKDPRANDPRSSHYCSVSYSGLHCLGWAARETRSSGHYPELSLEEPHFQCYLCWRLHHLGRFQRHRDLPNSLLPRCPANLGHTDLNPLSSHSCRRCGRQHHHGSNCPQSTRLTTVGALLMCIIQPEWAYWACAFPALLLNPIGADVLFTISNLVITSVFPSRTQGLAGGVFNTVAQIGKSVGLATSGVIAASITEHSKFHDKDSPKALMVGFRAAFWYLFALSCATGLLFVWGLRGIGKVGMKRE
jgi:hypothetical protein